MPPETQTQAPQTAEAPSVDAAKLTPELFAKLVDKVFELLLRDLEVERERMGASLGFKRWKGAR
jgi:hypothetical protein